PRAFELILGLSSDPVFGPIILFGQGGTSVEVIRDKAVALPPLNMNLAADLISRTRISRLLKGFRDHPPVKIEAVQLALIQLAQLAADFPEIKELDINPLFADENGVLALDARIKVEPAEIKGADRLAIRPYPKELEETVKLSDGRALLVRPIRPEDEPAHHVFHSRLTPDDIHFRFFGLVREFPHSQMARFTQIDYAREMAFIATAPDPQGAAETLGVVRVATDPDNLRAEFAIIIRSDLKGHGLGHLLLDKIIRYCRARGTHEIVGEVMEDNKAMLTLAHHLGFKTAGFPEGGVVRLKLELQTS
ncbi:GNAT family N-acetyltransferase, partial [Candidatus Sumerlaeota bacterium]|nr:GNAT family N-acetyltransferase [Candidatus Sumerlaeota bacterium]